MIAAETYLVHTKPEKVVPSDMGEENNRSSYSSCNTFAFSVTFRL